jgi:hypothetical protein
MMTMPIVFAGDPAPQQLTAPCRKYSGRSHPPIEQAVCRQFIKHLELVDRSFANRFVAAITDLTIRAKDAMRVRRGEPPRSDWP